MSSFDIGDISRWSASLTNARVSITPPHIQVFQAAFSSPGWLLVMQVAVPLAALYTCGLATLEIARLYKFLRPGRHMARMKLSPASLSTKKMSFIIVAIEAPLMLMVGVLMACGQFGNMMLPFRFHMACYLLFTGMSVVTTIFVAILVREEWRAAKGLKRRNIFDHWKVTIAIVIIAFGGFDLYNMSIGPSPASSQTTLLTSLVAVGIAQGGASIYFYAHAMALRSALRQIALLPVTVQHPENEKKLYRVILWLAVAGGACINATISTAFTMAGVGGYLRSETTGFTYSLNLFLFAFGRVLVSFTQVTFSNRLHSFFPPDQGSN